MAPTRRRSTHLATVTDPIDDATFTDALGIAGDLEDVLDALRPYDVSSIYGMLHKKPASGLGAFAFFEKIYPPFDMGNILEFCQSEHGGGEYRLQILAGSPAKTRKNVEFVVHGPPKAKGAPPTTPTPASNDMKMGDFLTLMLAQQAEARREASEARREAEERAARERRDADERQARRDAAMMNLATVAVPILAPLLLGDKREKLSDVVSLITANRPEGSSMKETLETITLVKALFDNPDKAAAAGFDFDDVMGSLAKMAGPAATALARAINPGRAGAASPVGEDTPQPTGPLMLPGADPPSPAQAVAMDPIRIAPPDAIGRVLHLVGDDVARAFQRGYDPDRAAQLVADRLDLAGIEEAELHAVVAQFYASSDWIADLAARGLDLRSNRQWAEDFRQALVAEFTGGDDAEDHDRHNDPGGDGGGAADAADHGAPGEGGQPKH